MLVYLNKFKLQAGVLTGLILLAVYPYYSADTTAIKDAITKTTNFNNSFSNLIKKLFSAIAWPFTRALSLYSYCGAALTLTIISFLGFTLYSDPSTFPVAVRGVEQVIQGTTACSSSLLGTASNGSSGLTNLMAGLSNMSANLQASGAATTIANTGNALSTAATNMSQSVSASMANSSMPTTPGLATAAPASASGGAKPTAKRLRWGNNKTFQGSVAPAMVAGSAAAAPPPPPQSVITGGGNTPSQMFQQIASLAAPLSTAIPPEFLAQLASTFESQS